MKIENGEFNNVFFSRLIIKIVNFYLVFIYKILFIFIVILKGSEYNVYYIYRVLISCLRLYSYLVVEFG